MLVPSISEISRQRTPGLPGHGDLRRIRRIDGAAGMSFDDRLPERKAETDRPFIVHPRARARQQHGTDVVGRRIRLVGPLDDPPLARAVDQQIRVEDVVGHQLVVES